MELVPVQKDGDYLEVHPTCLADHKRLGWKDCAKREAEPEAELSSEGMTAKEMKAALDELGISYKTNSSKAELQELLDNA